VILNKPIIATLISSAIVTGCANTQQETVEFRKTVKPIQNIISGDNDLQILASVEFGFPNHEMEIVEIKSVPFGTVDVCSGSYTESYKGNQYWRCQDGISRVDFHGDSTYSTKMSFKKLKRLAAYEQPSMFPSSFWGGYKEQLVALSHAAKNTYNKQLTYLSSANEEQDVMPLGIGLVYGKTYTFKDIEVLINEAGSEDTIIKLINKKKEQEKKTQKQKIADYKYDELQKRKAEQAKKELEAKNQLEMQRRTAKKQLLQRNNIGKNICKSGKFDLIARINGVSGGYDANGTITAILKEFSSDNSQVKVEVTGYSLVNKDVVPLNLPKLGDLSSKVNTLAWNDITDWILCDTKL